VSEAAVHSINVSDGGVPKRPRPRVEVRVGGLEGDRQADRRHHGGPDRAVSLYSLELIEALRREGHPIEPGSIGENLTLSGLDWEAVRPGTTLEVGEAMLEVVRPAEPCRKIAGAFRNGGFVRVSEQANPGWSRFYARVLREGAVGVGDRVVCRPGPGLS
jgi:MOSC domain-containing protein YiiM